MLCILYLDSSPLIALYSLACIHFQSMSQGVGNNCATSLSFAPNSVPVFFDVRTNLPFFIVIRFGLVIPPSESEATGVGSIPDVTSPSNFVGVFKSHKPNSVSPVRSVDTCSWKYKRYDFVPLSFQVSLHLFENQPSIPINKPGNVFANNPTWLNFSYCSKHLWPEMAFIFCPFSFSCK